MTYYIIYTSYIHHIYTTGKTMDFKEFVALNESFPAFFYPAFQLQNAFRVKTMGLDWWVDKLKKYRNVRRKLTASTENVDKLAQVIIITYYHILLHIITTLLHYYNYNIFILFHIDSYCVSF